MAKHGFEHLGPRKKAGKVLREFKVGKLRSGSKVKKPKRR